MIIIEKQAKFVPNAQLAIASVFAVGILACLVLCVAAFVLLIDVLTLALHAIGELVGSAAQLYVQADSLGKLIIWLCLVLALVKLSPVLARSIRRSLLLFIQRPSGQQQP